MGTYVRLTELGMVFGYGAFQQQKVIHYFSPQTLKNSMVPLFNFWVSTEPLNSTIHNIDTYRKNTTVISLVNFKRYYANTVNSAYSINQYCFEPKQIELSSCYRTLGMVRC